MSLAGDGHFLWLFVGLVIVRLWSGVEVESPLFSSSPVAVVVFAVLLGAALVAIGGRRQPERLNPGRWAVIAALTGVAISSVVWLLLSTQQHSATHQQAMYLLDNVQLNAEQAMRTRLDQMQRMAERLDAAGGDVDAALLTQDAQSYLRDMPSLKAIMLLDEEKQRLWSTTRTINEQMWLEQQITKPRVTHWLSVPLGQPRLMIPDATHPQRILLTILTESSNHQWLATFDISQMLNNELRMALGPFQVSINRGSESLLILHPAGFSADPVLTPDMALASRRAGLPGGVNFTLHAYPGAHYNWYMMSFMPVTVAMGGLLLSWMLAFSLGLVGAGVARARELTAAQLSLAESEQRYRSLFTHHPDAVFSLDGEGRFVTANASCVTITGYTHSEILDQHFTHFINADDMERV